ncbi:MAG: carboxypeptidase M32, partial [Clostridia bacterium]|nr:carboxypeptidase M32 [Clostridia bacterium]
RTESDEFTYTFHIIIRYEIEKMIVSGDAKIEDLPRIWNEKYREYLGIIPPCDKDGVLQDVHWTWGFGYFPTYALGNMYNAMYYNRMKNEIAIDSVVRAGDFKTLNGWMTENVFSKANILEPKKWIRDITGRDFTPNDFLDYLEEKYGEIYCI